MRHPSPSTLAMLILAVVLVSCAPEEKGEKRQPQKEIPLVAIENLHIVTGEVVYVPAYSQIHSMVEAGTIDLAVTLSVRNTDIRRPIIIRSVKYYSTGGELLKEYVETPMQLGPMASTEFFIEQSDKSGGAGANFIVEWGAEQPVYEPVIEAIMLGVRGTHAFAWRSPGRVMKVTE